MQVPDATTTLIGNLVRDPELKFTASGRAVCNLGMAVNRRWQQNNEWKEEVSFFDVTVWGPLGENVASSVEKGTRVIVTGRLEQQRWEQEGATRSKVVLVADAVGPDLKFCTAETTKVAREGGPGTPQQQPAPAPAKQEQTWDEEPF